VAVVPRGAATPRRALSHLSHISETPYDFFVYVPVALLFQTLEYHLCVSSAGKNAIFSASRLYARLNTAPSGGQRLKNSRVLGTPALVFSLSSFLSFSSFCCQV
jgi:hypothetical protein